MRRFALLRETVRAEILSLQSTAASKLRRHGGDGALIDFSFIPLAYDAVIRGARLPRRAALPTVARQEIRRRSKDIGNAVHQIAVAVAVEVDRIANIGRRKKLRLTDLSGPTAAQLAWRQVTASDNADRIQKLTGEEFGAAAIVGERRE